MIRSFFFSREQAVALKEAFAAMHRIYLAFKSRYEPECDANRLFTSLVRVRWLKFVAERLPTSMLDNSWVSNPPPYLEVHATSRSI